MEQERRLESRAQNKHGLNEPTWCYPCLFTADLCLHPCVCVCFQQHISAHTCTANLRCWVMTPRASL